LGFERELESGHLGSEFAEKKRGGEVRFSLLLRKKKEEISFSSFFCCGFFPHGIFARNSISISS
jgi:hypothetical protein